MFLFKLCFVVVFLYQGVAGQSPCPNIFQYAYENGRHLYGVIKAPVPNNFGNEIVLDVEFTVANNVPPGAIGKITLMASNEITIQNIMSGRPILFRLEFPQWQGVMPRVTKIFVNRFQICSGSPIQQDSSSPTVTTVTLKYTLNVSIPPSVWAGNTFTPAGDGEAFFTQITEQINPGRPSQTQRPTFVQYPFIQNQNIPIQNQIPFVQNPNDIQNTQRPTSSQNFPFIPVDQPNQNQYPITTSNRPQTPFVTSAPVLPPKINVSPTPRPNDLVDSVCGMVDNSVQLIHHGDDARKADYPWLGALFKQSSSGGTFICGATLFSKKHALTAAHCVNGVRPGRLHLILGRENINQWLSEGEQVQVIDTHVHENYIPRQGDGDVAILKLSREVRFTSVIRPICLWNTDDNLHNVVGMTGVVVGWGVDESGNSSTTPKKATLPIVSEEECLRSHSAFNLLTSNRTFCAGYRNDSGPCSGDSGSGFYMEINGRWFLRGIVSLSLLANDTCDLENFVVFADAAKFRDWVLAYITG